MNIVTIIAEAFLLDILCNHWKEVSRETLKHVNNSVDYKYVPERNLIESEYLRSIIKWEKFEKMKLIRILIRFIDHEIKDLDVIINKLKNHKYKIKDIQFILSRSPGYIKHFSIDLSKITTLEAASLLSYGHEYYLDKIDLLKHKFNFKESMNIIVGYKYNRDILEKVNYNSLKGYQVAEIIINTNERDIDILNLSTLTNIDWVNLLKERPNMIKYCDYEKFKKGDIFYSIKLCCMFDEPNLSYLIKERGMSEISPFGWEKLIIEKPEIFLEYCDFTKFDEYNWKKILDSHPGFIVYKI